ncbi:MAG: hypothetical protein Q4C70_10035, partial [Planctomycetia bacterium]|nr:hypothetical protein [Planctomycetia bacterium]
MSCGGKGTCGKCVVRLGDGRTVLACETILNDGAGGDDKTDAEQEMTVFLNLLDAESRWEILNGVLPGVLKKVELEEDSDAASDGLCFAFDIGTTTLAGCLLKGKSVIASTSRPNPQRCFGADVISRIEYGISGCSDLSGSSERSENKKIRELQHVLLQAIHEMMGEMLGRGGLAFSDVKCVVFAGNTTMEETLLGLSLESLATSPFLPSEGLGTVFSAGDSVWNGEFSDLPSEAEVRIFPVIGGFVGGDITAGILAVADDLGNNSENSSEND